MKELLYILAAVCGYIVAGFNPAITLSKMIYNKDIRECGSGNPGFTNFKRTFGNKWAWFVFAIDITKAAVVISIFAYLLSNEGVDFQFAAGYTGVFCMLGHIFPFQYKFKGGKGFLVCISTLFVVDWRAGLISLGIMIILLLTTKYMSLSTTLAMAVSPFVLILFDLPMCVIATMSVSVVLVVFRHKNNYIRLFKGEETKFFFRK